MALKTLKKSHIHLSFWFSNKTWLRIHLANHNVFSAQNHILLLSRWFSTVEGGRSPLQVGCVCVCVCVGVHTHMCVSCSVMFNCLWCYRLYSPPGSSVHGILQARILEWVAIPFAKGSSWSRDWTWVSCIAGRFFTVWVIREAPVWESHFNPSLAACNGLSGGRVELTWPHLDLLSITEWAFRHFFLSLHPGVLATSGHNKDEA